MAARELISIRLSAAEKQNHGVASRLTNNAVSLLSRAATMRTIDRHVAVLLLNIAAIKEPAMFYKHKTATWPATPCQNIRNTSPDIRTPVQRGNLSPSFFLFEFASCLNDVTSWSFAWCVHVDHVGHDIGLWERRGWMHEFRDESLIAW